MTWLRTILETFLSFFKDYIKEYTLAKDKVEVLGGEETIDALDKDITNILDSKSE